ncbi:MAG: cytochrome d ubiquinol oxidase subunit II [Desulfovibrionaceae bacterium]|nr:cytochrome d ubiquinol oxidase subunit II [Desulfovibrionaceae bacterium]
MLETIWFILWMLLWAVYFALDGFDLGLGALMPFIAKEEDDRRVIYHAAGPFWDGNEVWLIAAGGVTFAAFPKAYAVMFSALYTPLLMLLFALILRAVSFEFRDKILSYGWRTVWDFVHFIVNLVACILLGCAFGNLFMGIPVDANGVFHGSLLGLLNLYGLATALFFTCFFILHGALWLVIKSQGQLQIRAIATCNFMWPLVLLMGLLFIWLTLARTQLLNNYLTHPALFILPVLAVAGLAGARLFLTAGKVWLAFASNCIFIICLTFTGVSGMFPGIVISSIDPNATVTAFNGASTTLTLQIMLGVVAVMVPIVIAYQAWLYRLFAHPIDPNELEGH